MIDLELEQLVYGSFPFRDQGYDLLARSAGCSPELTAEVVAVCRRFGQPPSGDASRPAMFALKLPSGPWAVVGVAPQGSDDRGRPGALAFHALIVPAKDYARAGSNPFAFAFGHRSSWSPETPKILPKARCQVGPISRLDRPSDPSQIAPIVEALARRRRVAVESPGPIDRLALEVWASLPDRARSRASVATWAFSGENRFDLVAFPRLAGVALDDSYVAPSALLEAGPKPAPARTTRLLRTGVVVGLAASVLAGSIWRTSARRPPEPAASPTPTADPGPAALDLAGADRVQSRLSVLAGRLEGFEVGPSDDPARFLARIAEAVHYRGRILGATELDRIARDPDPDKARALAWHAQIQEFVDDRPLPGDFASTPLAGQLLAVARSFHLDPSLEPGSVADALIAGLARPGPIRPTPLAARFPALSDYARFLGKLPRRDDPP